MAATQLQVQSALDELQAMLGDVRIGDEGAAASASGTSVIDWNRTAELAKGCADSLRTEHARTSLGQTSLISYTSILLLSSLKAPSESSLSSQTQLCRVVGNLVLDHPQNRIRCLKEKIPQAILDLLEFLLASITLSDQTRIQTIKACTGALLNLTIDTPAIRKLLNDLNAPDILSKSLKLYTPGVWSSSDENTEDILLNAQTTEWTLKVISGLVAGEEVTISSTLGISLSRLILSLPLPSPDSSKSTSTTNFLSPEIRQALLEIDLTLLSTASEILETHIYKQDSLQDFLAFPEPIQKNNTLARCMDFVERAEVLPEWSTFVKKESTADVETRESEDDVEEEDQDEEEDLEVEKTFSNIKASIARIAIAIVSSDNVMNAVFSSSNSNSNSNQSNPSAAATNKVDLGWVIPRCINWLGGITREVNTRADLIITSSTMLANLARKDEYCISLIHEYNLARPLAFILSIYAQPPSLSSTTSTSTTGNGVPLSRPGEATQILHGVVGLLKNLAIPGSNKQIPYDEGIIEPLSILLREQLDIVLPVQNAAVGCLKHLCAGNVTSAIQVVLPPSSPRTILSSSPLTYILSLITRTNDVRLSSEATRLIGNVIRSLYSSRSITSPITPSTSLGGLELGLAKGKARDLLENSKESIQALSEMLRTGEKYPSLVNESIVALTLLTTTTTGAKLTLQQVIKHYEIPLSPTPSAPVDTTSPISRITNGLNDPSSSSSRSPSRRQSSNRGVPPPTSLDILLRWTTEYSISSISMPPELAGNALLLLDGLLKVVNKDSEEEKKSLRWNDIKAALGGVSKRNAQNNQELLVRDTAMRILQNMD